MPFVTVNIVGRGSPTLDGDTSSAGHMWYTIDDGSGATESYGFSPEQREWRGDGIVNLHGSDDSWYLERDFSGTYEISYAEYLALPSSSYLVKIEVTL